MGLQLSKNITGPALLGWLGLEYVHLIVEDKLGIDVFPSAIKVYPVGKLSQIKTVPVTASNLIALSKGTLALSAKVLLRSKVEEAIKQVLGEMALSQVVPPDASYTFVEEPKLPADTYYAADTPGKTLKKKLANIQAPKDGTDKLPHVDLGILHGPPFKWKEPKAGVQFVKIPQVIHDMYLPAALEFMSEPAAETKVSYDPKTAMHVITKDFGIGGDFSTPQGLVKETIPVAVSKEVADALTTVKVETNKAASKAAKEWESWDQSTLQTALTVPLTQAQFMYQPVNGTSSSSRYYMVAALQGLHVRIAARMNGPNMSIRLEGQGLASLGSKLKAVGLEEAKMSKSSNALYTSLHVDVGGEITLASKVLGSLLFGLMEPLATPWPDLKVIKGK